MSLNTPPNNTATSFGSRCSTDRGGNWFSSVCSKVLETTGVDKTYRPAMLPQTRRTRNRCIPRNPTATPVTMPLNVKPSGVMKKVSSLSMNNNGGNADWRWREGYKPGTTAAREALEAKPNASLKFRMATLVSELKTITKSPP